MTTFSELSPSFFIYFKIGLLLIFTIWIYKNFINKCKRDPRLKNFSKQFPGPTELPFLGNGLDFYHGGTTLMKKIMEYDTKYEHRYRLWFGNHLVICLSKVEDLEVVFMNSKMLGKPELFRFFQLFWGDGLFTGPMHIWKKNRKRFQPIFGNNVMGFYAPEFNEKIYNAVNRMKKLVNGPEFDAWDYLPYLSFDVITKTSVNVELDWNNKSTLKYHECVKKAMEASVLKMFRPWLHIKFIRDLCYKKQDQKVRDAMLGFSKEIVENKLHEIKKDLQLRNTHKEQSSDTEISLKSFLTTSYQIQEETGDENIMHDEIITMITAGTDTTAITNGFFLLAVAIHQNIQNALYEEIYSVFGNSNREADYDDVKRLPYLDQVLKETLRRFTLVPVIFRDVEEDCKIGDRLFPAGTAIMVSIVGVHFNPEYYPDPWKFNPENFSPEAVDKRHKLTFLPFSAGPRNCIGLNYAMLEMKLTLIALLRNFSFHTSVKMEDIEMNMGFLMTSAHGYKMSIRPRN